MRTYVSALSVLALILTHAENVPYADWFMSLHQPEKPKSSCCGEADQYYVKDLTPSTEPNIAFTAIVYGKYDWLPTFTVDVPSSTVMWNTNNPTGRPVIFIQVTEYDTRKVLCFIPGTGT